MLLSPSGSSTLLLAYLVFGLVVGVIAPLSGWLKSHALLSEPLLSMLVGLILGLAAPLWTNSQLSQSQLRLLALEIARVTIAIQCLNSGMRVRKLFYSKYWGTLTLYLTIVLVGMWITSAALVLACFPTLSLKEAALIGAMLAPTDPVLASAILRGQESQVGIPNRIKELLVAESAANDGLALPLVYLPLLLTIYPSAGHAIGLWFYDVWLYQVLLGALIGAVWGAAAALLLNFATARGLPDKESRLAFEVALALGVLGGVEAMGSDGVLACFTAGVAFYMVQHLETDPALESEATTADALDILLTFSFFLYLGVILPWSAWGQLGIGRLFLVSCALLVCTRLPFTLALHALRWTPAVHTYPDALFVGWFGPVGVAAIYYAADYFEQTGEGDDTPFEIISFVVLTQVVAFSITGPLFSRWYVAHLPATAPLPGILRDASTNESTIQNLESAISVPQASAVPLPPPDENVSLPSLATPPEIPIAVLDPAIPGA